MTTCITADCGHQIDERMYAHWRRPDGSWGRGCYECSAATNAQMKAKRKAQLDALPRCEVPGCARRGTMILMGQALMCGKHSKQAQAIHRRIVAETGVLGWFYAGSYTKDGLLKMAVGK